MGTINETRAALKTWREGLVGLDRRSRLLRFRAPKTSSLRLDGPSPDAILELLRSGKLQSFVGDVVDPETGVARPARAGTFLHVPRVDTEIGPVVRTLMRRANEEFLDRGLSVLYVAFGMLKWKDVDGSEMASPIYLLPVELLPEGPRATPRIKGGEDDAVLNPALPLRLNEFGVTLPTYEDVDGLSLSEILDRYTSALSTAKDFKDWSLDPEVHLSTFSFAKEAMYKDLLDNEAAIAEHPVIRALANGDPTSQSDEFQFDPVDPVDIDEIAPPERTPLVLDADSSQRAAVAAALAGRSFVMDGPPGTGKSQTIANMIGALLHAGKSVLFVSEKIAALDVVKNRLKDSGLESYLLELHSHKTNRKDVANELLRTLDNVAQPPRAMSASTRTALEDRRRRLNSYALAMNEARSPLQASLHDILGELAGMVHVPVAPTPNRPPLQLSDDGRAALSDTLKRLERTWRPAAQGSTFLWRDVTDETSLESRLYSARTALEELEGTVQLNRGLAEAFELTAPRQTQTLIDLLALQHTNRPPYVNDGWLTTSDWSSIQTDRADLGSLVAAFHEAADKVMTLAGVDYESFPPELPPAPEPIPVRGAVDIAALTTSELRTTADAFEARESSLTSTVESVSNLARLIGMPEIVSFADTDRAVRIVQIHRDYPGIDASWFTASDLRAARDAASTLHHKSLALDHAENQASKLFSPTALAAPLRELEDRFTNLHTGIRKLSAAYRTDKKALGALLADAKQVKSGIARLSDAIAWSDAASEFDAAGAAYGAALGRWWQGRATNWDELTRFMAAAEEVVALTGDTVSPALKAYMAHTSADAAHVHVADTAREVIAAWRNDVAPQPALTGRPELLVEPVAASVSWLSAHVAPMRSAATRVESISRHSARDHTLAEAESIIAAVDVAREAVRALDASAEKMTRQFGGLFVSHRTDLAAVDSALEWASRVRDTVDGALTVAQVHALNASADTENLANILHKWESARDEIVRAFHADRTSELHHDFGEVRAAFELIAEFQQDTIGQREWFDYQSIRTELRELDLDSTVEFCIEQRIPASDVPKVVERALLRAWADEHIRTDTRLQPLLAADRAALVEEFQNLDREVVAAATSDIIQAANTRRPANTSLGEPALIRREGMKQRRHMAVRNLIAQTRSATQAIKPVFMMSPLAVSQYLPHDLKFDVVIFDEASQVTPGDSINCIYRGRSFILAGDDRQLPPSQFFERVIESDDVDDLESDVKDFTSILELAKSSGAFRNLSLRWHYRSRHEALIAFSNYRFYEGHLITYPSAQEEGADVGVEFIHVDGMYRRGGGADNPKEAKAVAERVIHHYRTRPGLSLGVVTFSVAQAAAVIAAVDDVRNQHRDLDAHFDKSDRLNGFFVRSLESVQGDERDVILFSIGYGPDEAGKISTNFGVLNKAKGWRRLNVGVTRARQRIEVVASMEAGDIPPSSNENVEALRAYLDFVRRGITTLGTQASATGLMPDSPFEESVIRAIQSWGYVVEPQVGAAGFRIDIGVRHPAKPGSFVLGVECDGYQYHSAPAARDRDRLRDQVLSGLGWTLHRIWGTGWYRDRIQEESRLRAAIEAAVAGTSSRTRTFAIVRPTVETAAAEIDTPYAWAVDYVEAAPVKLPHWVEPAEPGNHLHLVEALVTLAQTEGPVHLDTVSERIREWWSVGRVTSRLKDNIDRAILKAGLERDGDFIDVPNRPVSKVRSRNQNRKPEQVHLDEFALAAEMLVRDVGGASRSEVIVAIARQFGWGRTGAIVDARLNAAVEQAVERGVLVQNGEALSSARTAP
ncbi:DUF3320 domain-containing protein [Microbacterium limosum]|uniref:DUF3320 domain-containing protein n=1 Tax=Microbacterium limosum TaxID=3079935 RepID=A0AAU0MK95_9MICO|nr:DUF3320 domain-containing protein [Microbacterium sp. Y20]WOQ70385.1 DUF3320 domain-containing protein [Microbacterium sp. Y20]